jgi:hypothetical protein
MLVKLYELPTYSTSNKEREESAQSKQVGSHQKQQTMMRRMQTGTYNKKSMSDPRP